MTMPTTVQQKGRSMGTVARLPVAAPQPAPSETDETAAFTRVMFEAAIAEGYRRACEEFGIPYFPPVQSRHLSVVGAS